MITTIRITAEHIEKGKPGECGTCPIALAFLELFPGMRIEVIGPVVFIGNKAYNLPMACVDFVGRYDNNKDVEPFSFQFDMVTANRDWRKVWQSLNCCAGSGRRWKDHCRECLE